jgi:hypothetical protein
MQSESRQAHWEDVYAKKGENEVSWFQEKPTPSLELIAQVSATSASAIIDIGGGASRLVDNLVDRGFEDAPFLIYPKLHLRPPKHALGAVQQRSIGLSRTLQSGSRGFGEQQASRRF